MTGVKGAPGLNSGDSIRGNMVIFMDGQCP